MSDETTQQNEQQSDTTTRALVVGQGNMLELAVVAWLDAKGKRSGSVATPRAYGDTLRAFRAALRSQGLDLNSAPENVALVAQAWLSRTFDGSRQVANTTYNQRRAALSSFYGFRARRRLIGPGEPSENPMSLLDPQQVDEYAGATPIPTQSAQSRLAAIDRTTPIGARDYALLTLGLRTGRRVAELAGLRCGDLTPLGRDIERDGLLVIWRRCKGGKVMRDELRGSVAVALMRWLSLAYPGQSIEQLSRTRPDAPVWLTLGRNPAHRGAAMTPRTAALVCERRLGVSKAHALRHTFALEMEKAGAPVSLIQQKLGHSSLAITGRYLSKLTSHTNPYAEQLEIAFGIA